MNILLKKHLYVIVFCASFLFAGILFLSGKADAAEYLPAARDGIGTQVANIQGLAQVERANAGNRGGFHAMAGGTLVPVQGTVVAVTGNALMVPRTTQWLQTACKNYNGDFTYTSSDTNIATVTDKGLVTAVTSGAVTITVQTQPVGTSTVVCKGEIKITVLSSSYSLLWGMNLSVTGTNMAPGIKQHVKVIPYPTNAYIEPGFKYESSDTRVVQIDQNGVMTAVTAGTAIITVTSKDGQNIKSSLVITVTESKNISVTNIEFYGKEEMYLGDKQTIAALVRPLNASVNTVTYSSSAESVVTVSNKGEVQAVGLGTAQIIARAQDSSGVTGVFTVKVVPKLVNKITVPSEIAMELGETKEINPTIEPADATNRAMNYTSSNVAIVSVSNKGFLSANGIGTADITITAADGSNVKASFKVTVKEKTIMVESIALNLPGSNELAIDEERSIKAVVFPFNATDSDLEWFVSNDEVLSVDDGIITGLEAGTSVVIVSATDGSGITARLTVKVYEPVGEPKSISLEGSTVMVLDESQILSVVLEPERTIMPDLEWSSNNEDVLSVVDGEVSADAIGTATIKASDETGKLKASITITVVEEEEDDDEDDEASIELLNAGETLKLKEGESYTVRTNYNVDSTVQSLSWRTSDSVVASVNQKGKITARKKGTALITISTMDGEATEQIRVTVSKKVYKIKFTNLTVPSANKLKIKVGKNKKLKYSLQVDGTEAATMSWSTSNKSIAKITSKGRLTGVAKGKAKITLKIKLVNGKNVKKSFWAVVKK